MQSYVWPLEGHSTLNITQSIGRINQLFKSSKTVGGPVVWNDSKH